MKRSLLSEGVDRDDIQTQQFQIYPQFDYSGEREELVGYTVTNTVVAKLREVDMAGETIDAAIAAGGDDTLVQGVGFSVEDDAERLAEARARAWEDAARSGRLDGDHLRALLGDGVMALSTE